MTFSHRLAWFLACTVSSLSSFAASAPDSLNGLILREYRNTSAHEYSYVVTSMGSDGTYAELIYATRTTTTPSAYVTPGNGTYTYTKTGPMTAVLSRTASGAPTNTVELMFTSDPWGAYFLTTGGGGLASFAFSDAGAAPPLMNISARMTVRAGNSAIVGFVVQGTQPSDFLIRAVGPGVAALGVSSPVGDPALTVFDSHGSPLKQNDNWSSGDSPLSLQRVQALVGAFPLAPGSKDAALLITLNPGAYTVAVDPSSNRDTGDALVEVYLLP